jgi:hypothetical protein
MRAKRAREALLKASEEALRYRTDKPEPKREAKG